MHIILADMLKVFRLRLSSSNFTSSVEPVFSASSRERGCHQKETFPKYVLCDISKTL